MKCLLNLLVTTASLDNFWLQTTHILRLHGQFCVVSLPYMDNEWSVSERDLLSQHPERANALATWTGRRLVRKVLSNSSTIVSVIYFHPHSSHQTYQDELESQLESLNLSNKKVFVMGDFNINLLQKSQPVVEILNIFGFHIPYWLPNALYDESNTIFTWPYLYKPAW